MKKDLQVPALGIAGWAINGEIALSAVPPAVDTAGKQIASGLLVSTAMQVGWSRLASFTKSKPATADF